MTYSGRLDKSASPMALLGLGSLALGAGQMGYQWWKNRQANNAVKDDEEETERLLRDDSPAARFREYQADSDVVEKRQKLEKEYFEQHGSDILKRNQRQNDAVKALGTSPEQVQFSQSGALTHKGNEVASAEQMKAHRQRFGNDRTSVEARRSLGWEAGGGDNRARDMADAVFAKPGDRLKPSSTAGQLSKVKQDASEHADKQIKQEWDEKQHPAIKRLADQQAKKIND